MLSLFYRFILSACRRLNECVKKNETEIVNFFIFSTHDANPKQAICTVMISRFVEQSHVEVMKVSTVEKESDPYWDRLGRPR